MIELRGWLAILVCAAVLALGWWLAGSWGVVIALAYLTRKFWFPPFWRWLNAPDPQ